MAAQVTGGESIPKWLAQIQVKRGLGCLRAEMSSSGSHFRRREGPDPFQGANGVAWQGGGGGEGGWMARGKKGARDEREPLRGGLVYFRWPVWKPQ